MTDTTFIATASDGTMHFDEDKFNALARVLLDMSGRVMGITITEIDAHYSLVNHDTEYNGLTVNKSNPDILNQWNIGFTVDQVKAVKQLHDLAQMAEVTRDNLMTSILGVMNDADKDEVEVVRDQDIPASEKKTVAMVKMASTTTKH